MKGSLVLSMEERMQVERLFFSPLHLGEKMSLFLASVGIQLSQLSSMRAGTVCECQFSTFPFSQT